MFKHKMAFNGKYSIKTYKTPALSLSLGNKNVNGVY